MWCAPTRRLELGAAASPPPSCCSDINTTSTSPPSGRSFKEPDKPSTAPFWNSQVVLLVMSYNVVNEKILRKSDSTIRFSVSLNITPGYNLLGNDSYADSRNRRAIELHKDQKVANRNWQTFCWRKYGRGVRGWCSFSSIRKSARGPAAMSMRGSLLLGGPKPILLTSPDFDCASCVCQFVNRSKPIVKQFAA